MLILYHLKTVAETFRIILSTGSDTVDIKMIPALLYIAVLLYLLHCYLNRNFKEFEKSDIQVAGPKSFYDFVINSFKGTYSARDFNMQIYQNLKNYTIGAFYGSYAPFYFITDLEIMKDIFIRDFDHFTDRIRTTFQHYPLVGRNLFFSSGRDWRVARTLMTPVFTSRKIKSMDHIVLSCAKDLETSILQNLEYNEEFDTKTLFKECTVNIIARTAFGIEPEETFLKKICDFDVFGSKAKLVYYSASLLLPQFLQKFFYFPLLNSDAYYAIVETVRNEVDLRVKTGKRRQDFLQHVIDILENPDNKEIDPEIIFSQTTAFLLAGFDTTNTIFTFAIYELALNPDIQTQLRNEIRQGLKTIDNVWSYEIIKQLKLLDMVIQETLRKYPPVPRLERYCNKDYKFKNSNFTVKKGSFVACSVIGFQYDSELFPNPSKFDPWRFEENRKPAGFFPFGIGPRDCIGKRFALMTIALNMAYILNNFEFIATKNTPTSVQYVDCGIHLKAKSPLWVKVEKIPNLMNA